MKPTEEQAASFGSHIPQLDALRGAACLAVLVAHLRALPAMGALPDVLGVAGVGVFFALSGFLITRGLVQGDRRLTAFYNRRAARILPPYLLLVAVLAIVWPGKPLLWVATFCFNWLYRSGSREYFHVDAGDAPIPPVGHTWSLCVEEHFYWVWPPLLVWLSPKWAARLALAVVLATPAIAYWMILALHVRDFRWLEIDGLVQRITLTQMTAIALGCWIGVHESTMAKPIQMGSSTMPRLALLSIPAVVVPLLFYLTSTSAISVIELALGPSCLHIFCAGVFGLGLCWKGLGRAKWLCWIGRISYGLYLYHLPFYAWLGLAGGSAEGVGQPTWSVGLLAVGLTFAAATASYRWLEKPMIQWSKRRNQTDATSDGGEEALSQPTHPSRLGLGIALALAVACIATVSMSQQRKTVDALLNVTPEIPEPLRREVLRPTGVATSAYRWMGVVHSVDENGFRRSTPIPARREGVWRVATLGDSYTWAACVEEDESYSAVAEKQLRARAATGSQSMDVEVEVLNCGKAGGQAEDLLIALTEQVLPLQPNVVVYGVTVNDVLPAIALGQGDPKPLWNDDVAVQKFQSILSEMKQACESAGTKFGCFVITQKPDQPAEAELVRHIQTLCAAAGVQVMPVDGYLESNRERNFEFSVWDRHPNSQCHRLYGTMLAEFLVALRQ